MPKLTNYKETTFSCLCEIRPAGCLKKKGTNSIPGYIRQNIVWLLLYKFSVKIRRRLIGSFYIKKKRKILGSNLTVTGPYIPQLVNFKSWVPKLKMKEDYDLVYRRLKFLHFVDYAIMVFQRSVLIFRRSKRIR